MKHLIVISSLALALATAAAAQSDPIASRNSLMKEQGKAVYNELGKMQKGETPYDQALVDKDLATVIKNAKTAPSLFPDGSQTGGKTRALPAIWTSKADFEAKFKKLIDDTTAQQGKITDVASLKAAWTTINKDCNDCHKAYRAPDKD